MTENEAIEYVKKMGDFEKAKAYMNYFIYMLYLKYTSEYYKMYPDKWVTPTLDKFTCKSNIQVTDTGCDDWKGKGFAAKSWVVLRAGSIYHYVYHNIK